MLFLYMFCALWGYGAVFGEALATYAPVPFLGDMGAYRMYVVLFGLVVVPLSTLDIKEQAVFQVSVDVSGFGLALKLTIEQHRYARKYAEDILRLIKIQDAHDALDALQ